MSLFDSNKFGTLQNKESKHSFSLFGNKGSTLGKRKLFGGEGNEVSGFTLLAIVIISFVIIGVVYWVALRDPEEAKLKRGCKKACKQINKQCNEYCDKDFVDDWHKFEDALQYGGDQYGNPATPPLPPGPPPFEPKPIPPPPGITPEEWAKIQQERRGKGGKEGFLRSKFAAAYKDTGEPMHVSDWCTLKTAYDNINKGVVGLKNKSGQEQFREGYETEEETGTTTGVNGSSDKCRRDFLTKFHRKGPLAGAAIEKCIDCKGIDPVKGFSNANVRVNGFYPAAPEACMDLTKCSKTKGIEPFTKLDNVLIDDKGYSNSEAYLPTNCNTPMCSNSRLAGSSMNCSSLIGAFRKFDTDPNFFKSPAPFPPKLNFLKGEPNKLKYCANPDF